ncbi:hypothetical protein MF271_11795 [Deinococcus sp. KNUC1210]|uniref:hypothetical protein n=1 Tax=Deinococcus sp. KNUC1210 TaxID=2917691 RepID=UPI001EF11844|nr:hypothetical protein [Deinococcus sp. KNUC1210]ULH14688.1 hypothetical protein MF271_11795 [Deinococcus sp. KNUC1210]
MKNSGKFSTLALTMVIFGCAPAPSSHMDAQHGGLFSSGQSWRISSQIDIHTFTIPMKKSYLLPPFYGPNDYIYSSSDADDLTNLYEFSYKEADTQKKSYYSVSYLEKGVKKTTHLCIIFSEDIDDSTSEIKGRLFEYENAGSIQNQKDIYLSTKADSAGITKSCKITRVK